MSILDQAKQVIDIEIAGLTQISNQLDDHFEQAVKAILNTHGRTIICGMGKSGIIGKKLPHHLLARARQAFYAPRRGVSW